MLTCDFDNAHDEGDSLQMAFAAANEESLKMS
jgi:hypothetical protein